MGQCDSQTMQESSQNESMRIRAEGKVPEYANAYAAGLDLPYLADEPLLLKPGDHVMVHTGVSVELPRRTFGLVVIRSSLGSKGLMLANGIGIIDEDYRGEIRMPLFHHGEEAIRIEPGERVAQMVVVPYLQPHLIPTEQLSKTDRGESGFGSSGRF